MQNDNKRINYVGEEQFIVGRLASIVKCSTDSIVLQTGKTFFTNPDLQNKAILWTAYRALYASLYGFKKSKKVDYDECIKEIASRKQEELEAILLLIGLEFNNEWEEKKNNLSTYALDIAKDEFYGEFGYACINRDKKNEEIRYSMALVKNWLLESDFEPINFYTETICSHIGITDAATIKQEKEKVLSLFKKYDNWQD